MVKVNDLSNEIADLLSEYTQEVEEGLEEAKEKVAKDGAKKLKERSPKKTSDYAKGWRATQMDGDWVIHNDKKPSLTHLLEHGHAKRSGGRVAGKPHIGPTEEEVIKEYEKEVERVIKG